MKLNIVLIISSSVNENMTSLSKNKKINDDFRRNSFENNNENVFAAISINIDQFNAHYFTDNQAGRRVPYVAYVFYIQTCIKHAYNLSKKTKIDYVIKTNMNFYKKTIFYF